VLTDTVKQVFKGATAMKKIAALSDVFVRAVKKPGKHADGRGLYLLVAVSDDGTAGKLWRMDFRHAGKRGTLALGRYPDLSLADARKRCDEARALLAQGINPSRAKREAKAAQAVAAANTFEAVAREFHGLQADSWSPKYTTNWLGRMEKDLFPFIGKLPIAEITPHRLLQALRRVEGRGAIDTAHALRQTAGQVFRYAIQTSRAERNPVADLQGALKAPVIKHMAAVLEPVKVGELMRAIDGYEGQPITRAALQLSALLFQRPGNIRAMEWAWLNLDAAMLTIPPESMKRRVHQKINGRPHLVPLASQAVAILQELRLLTGHGRYVFPSLRTGERPMSDNTVNAALRRLGYSSDEATAHGFRAMARTLIVERLPGIDPEVVEAQLAHGKSGPLGAAYDRAEYMEQRRKMMRTWADYLDKLRVGGTVIPFKAA
jgi:integrase